MTTQADVPVAAAATDVTLPRLRVGGAFSVGRFSESRVLALAAAAPPGSDDPVDLAAAAALQADRPDIALPQVEPQDIDPARLDRRYSLVRVRDFALTEGGTADLVVMRGDMASVLKQAKAAREDRTIMIKNADLASRRGARPLAVATAPVGKGDVVGAFTLEGFVTVLPETLSGTAADMASSPGSWARVNVWSVSLRYQHWINVAMVFILSCSGYYIMDPFFGPTAYDGVPTGFLMGWVRLIHFTAAFIWLVVGATRVVSAFTSRDRYLRWPSMWPLKSKQDVRNLGKVVKHYAFISEDGPLYLAHNPLQQLTYTLLYVACGVQMLTGLSLYSLYHQDLLFWQIVATPVHLFGIAPVRLFHAMMMFFLWAFVIVHVYLAVRADSLERHGGLSAMINGGVWLRRGSQPVDAPEIG